MSHSMAACKITFFSSNSSPCCTYFHVQLVNATESASQRQQHAFLRCRPASCEIIQRSLLIILTVPSPCSAPSLDPRDQSIVVDSQEHYPDTLLGILPTSWFKYVQPHLYNMATATEAPLPSASTESNLLDANGTPPSNQVVLDANNNNTIIQNNIIGEGVTLNIRSSNCNGSTVTKLEYVVGTAERTSSRPLLARQLVPVEYGRESIVFSGNAFGQYVMINIGSHNCTGAIKQTDLTKISNYA